MSSINIDELRARGGPLRVQPDNIPEELRRLRQWVLWGLEARDGKVTKTPYCAVGDGRASVTDPRTYAGFDVVLARYLTGDWSGIGFVLTEDDPYTAIDLDDCRDPVSGAITEDAHSIIVGLDSYTEWSPSGCGGRVLVRGKLPPGKRRHGWVEAYHDKRYVTLTGHLDADSPLTIADRQAELDAFHARWLGGTKSKPAAKLVPAVEVACPSAASAAALALPFGPTSGSQALTDDELLALARGAQNGEKFQQLYSGAWSGLYESQSQADLALCRLLQFWSGGNPQQMDRLFRGSGLMRLKWDARRGALTYGQRTITEALNGGDEKYFAVPAASAAAAVGASASVVGSAQAPMGQLAALPAPQLVVSAESSLTNAATRLQTVKARDLLRAEFPDPRWLAKDMLPEGSTLLAGKPKVGKSWLALDLGVTVASGGDVLGQGRVEPGDVLYLALEDSKRRLKERLRLMLGDQSPPDGLELTTECPPLDRGGLDYMTDWLAHHSAARLIIIDTLKRIRPTTQRGQTQYEADYQPLAQLTDLANHHHVSVVVLHHLRKASGDDPFDLVSGTLGMTGAVDTIAVLVRGAKQADAAFHVRGRDVEEQEWLLHWDATTYTWEARPADEEYTGSPERQAIKRVIRQHGRSSIKEVADLTRKTYDQTKSLMAKMTNDGELKSVGRGYYELPQGPRLL